MTRAFLFFAARRTSALVFLAAIPCLVLFFARSARFGSDETRDAPVWRAEVRWPGKSAPRVETAVLRPLEEAASGLAGLEGMTGSAEAGRAVLVFRYREGFDRLRAGSELRERLANAATGFPEDCEKPVLSESGEEDEAGFVLLLRGDAPREEADPEIGLLSLLEKIPGVCDVRLCGRPIPEVRIRLRSSDLRSRGLDSAAVRRGLQEAHVARPVGTVRGGGRDVQLGFEGRLRSLGEMRALPIRGTDGSLVRLGDLGTVALERREPEERFTVDGVDHRCLLVRKASGASSWEVSRGLHAAREEWNRRVKTDGPRLEILVDEAAPLLRRLRILLGAIALLLVLSFLVPLANRSLLAVAPCGLFSLSFASLVLLLTGRSFSPWTLAGLLVGFFLAWIPNRTFFHLLRGNAESISRKRDVARRFLRRAAIPWVLAFGCAAVPVGILAGLRVPGILPFGVAVLSSFAGALLYAFFLLPALIPSRGARPRESSAKGGLERGSLPFGWMKRLLLAVRRAFRGKARGCVVSLSIPALVFCVWKQAGAPSPGSEGVEPEVIRGVLELPPETPSARTSLLALQVEDRIRAFLGPRSGTPLRIEARTVPGRATFRMEGDFGSEANRRDCLRSLERAVRGHEEGFVHFEPGDPAGESPGELRADLLGDDLPEMERRAARLAEEASRLSGVRDVLLHFREGRPIRRIRPDRDAASKAALDASAFIDAGRDAFDGPVVLKWVHRNREVDLRLSVEDPTVGPSDRLRRLPVGSGRTSMGPFVAETPSTEPARIRHLDKRRVVSFSVLCDGEEAERRVAAILRSPGDPDPVRLSSAGREEVPRAGFAWWFLLFVLWACCLVSTGERIGPGLCVATLAFGGACAALVLFQRPGDAGATLGLGLSFAASAFSGPRRFLPASRSVVLSLLGAASSLLAVSFVTGEGGFLTLSVALLGALAVCGSGSLLFRFRLTPRGRERAWIDSSRRERVRLG